MSNNKYRSDNHISEILDDSASLTQTLQSGIYSALLKHKQAGNAVCEWRDDQVMWIEPEHIPASVDATLRNIDRD